MALVVRIITNTEFRSLYSQIIAWMHMQTHEVGIYTEDGLRATGCNIEQLPFQGWRFFGNRRWCIYIC